VAILLQCATTQTAGTVARHPGGTAQITEIYIRGCGQVGGSLGTGLEVALLDNYKQPEEENAGDGQQGADGNPTVNSM